MIAMDFEEITKIFENLQKNYEVNDLLDNKVKIIFLLESPHKDEIAKKYPLAGKSGKYMSKKLVNNASKPFGELVKNKKANRDLNLFAIMNVSTIPLQETAYNQEVRRINNEFLRNLKLIRKNPTKRSMPNIAYNIDTINLIIEYLKENLKQRVEEYKNKKNLFILCGKIAKEFFESLNLKEETIYVPHPSNGQWNHKKYISEIKQMKEKIEEYKAVKK